MRSLVALTAAWPRSNRVIEFHFVGSPRASLLPSSELTSEEPPSEESDDTAFRDDFLPPVDFKYCWANTKRRCKEEGRRGRLAGFRELPGT